MPDLNPDELETLVIGATRYALGRQTYVVWEMAEMLTRHWAGLPGNTRRVIQRDVEQAFEEHARGYRSLGAEHDVRQWERVRALWKGMEIDG